MNVEIGTEAAQFPEKEYINGIFIAVYSSLSSKTSGKEGEFRCISSQWQREPALYSPVEKEVRLHGKFSSSYTLVLYHGRINTSSKDSTYGLGSNHGVSHRFVYN
jgi:hypothetical protein